MFAQYIATQPILDLCEAYGAPLENVRAFKYLRQVMTAGDDDWHAVVGNLCKARKSWGRLLRILIR